MCQWAEIQARSRKLSIDDFLFLAEQKKQLLQTTLEVKYMYLLYDLLVLMYLYSSVYTYAWNGNLLLSP